MIEVHFLRSFSRNNYATSVREPSHYPLSKNRKFKEINRCHFPVPRVTTYVEDKVQIVTILKDKSEQINTIDQIS